MNREEEIKQAIKDICSCEFCKFDKDYCPFCKERNVTVDAINWADQHPRKGLWDAQKVCAWIGNHLLTSQQGYLLEDLRKAMEE